MIQSINRKALMILFASIIAAAAFALVASPTQASASHETVSTAGAVERDETGRVDIQTAGECVYYLYRAGYVLTSDRISACKAGGNGNHAACYGGLVFSRVSFFHAERACNAAIQ